MKKNFLLTISFLFTVISFSQSLSHVTLSGATSLSSFSFLTDQQAIISVTPDGRLLEWGVEMQPGRIGYYQGKLDPYMGRVDYNSVDADEALRGKVKSIGSCNITYFTSSMPEAKRGKVKTIGAVALDYYMDYDNESYKGKLKSAGYLSIGYYASYDNEYFRGKLKMVGNTTLTYYSIFDDKLNKGKIKSIGTSIYSWYNEFDRKEYQGAMKSGAAIQKVNGVTYNTY